VSMLDWWMQVLGIIIVVGPFLLLVGLGIPPLLSVKLSERAVSRSVQFVTSVGLLAGLGLLGLMLSTGKRHVPIVLAHWVDIPDYHMLLKIEFDRLSVPFVILTFLLCGTISAFSAKYMHREGGFNRFHMLYALFLTGMIVTSVSGTIETLFAGWEMVGLSSALLVAFYQERPAPMRNGLHVWVVYRVSDAALLLASIWLHHLRGHGNFDAFLGATPWPDGKTILSSWDALFVGVLLLAAAIGKSALVPTSGWLPRAMEGPTPSSAVFYGALSVHLGAFLLLRVSPLLDQSLLLSALVVVVGLTTAIFAALFTRVQTDIKCALSFASLTQVGLIVAEIGLGFRYLALIHILGHGCVRTLQFVRAPTLLLDHRRLEDALGTRLGSQYAPPPEEAADSFRSRFYRWAMERGYLDAFLVERCVRPILAIFVFCDSLERRWTDWLSGTRSRRTEYLQRHTGTADDLP